MGLAINGTFIGLIISEDDLYVGSLTYPPPLYIGTVLSILSRSLLIPNNPPIGEPIIIREASNSKISNAKIFFGFHYVQTHTLHSL